MQRIYVYASVLILSLSIPLFGLYLAIATHSQYEKYSGTTTKRIEEIANTIETSSEEYSSQQLAGFLRISGERIVENALIEREIRVSVFFGICTFFAIWISFYLGRRNAKKDGSVQSYERFSS